MGSRHTGVTRPLRRLLFSRRSGTCTRGRPLDHSAYCHRDPVRDCWRATALLRGPAVEMSSSGLRNCENGDCIVGSRARYKVYTGGADPLRQSHVLAHTRATPAFTKRHDNVQPPLGARARGDAELAIGHREGVINRYRSRRQRRRAQSEPVHASGQHFTRATLAPQ